MAERRKEEFGKRKTMFKTLRRLHGQNLDHSGLNDLTEAFAAFMTRARFFSIGHLRRTWSHSAVEFMKYRRRLPALMDSKDQNDEEGTEDLPRRSDMSESAIILEEICPETGIKFSRYSGGSGSFREASTSSKSAQDKPPTPDPRKIYVANISYRVTCVPGTLLDDHSLVMVASHCPFLLKVDLTGLKVGWQALKLFAENCPNLQAVAYKDASNLGEKAFWYLFRNCNNLRIVDLSGCRRLAGRCFRLLGLFLEEVVLNGCVRLETQAIEEICLKSPNVRILRLDECYRLTDECLNLISRYLSENLQVLSLCGDMFMQISSEGLENLGRMDKITELRLDNNPAVTDQVLLCVAGGCPSLEILSLAEAGKQGEEISEQGLRALSSCRSLKEVNLSYLSSVKDSVLSGLASHKVLEVVKGIIYNLRDT